MDKQTFKIRATEVSESLRSFIATAMSELSDDQAEQSVRLTDSMRDWADKLDGHQAKRDSEVLASVAGQVRALRDDVRRFGSERDAANAKALDAALALGLNTVREEAANGRKEITEEISRADRSNYEQLEAMIRGLKGG